MPTKLLWITITVSLLAAVAFYSVKVTLPPYEVDDQVNSNPLYLGEFAGRITFRKMVKIALCTFSNALTFCMQLSRDYSEIVAY